DRSKRQERAMKANLKTSCAAGRRQQPVASGGRSRAKARPVEKERVERTPVAEEPELIDEDEDEDEGDDDTELEGGAEAAAAPEGAEDEGPNSPDDALGLYLRHLG